MSELNEDIDNLFREIIEPAEMRPNQMVWTAIENNLEKSHNIKLQKRLKHLVTYSIVSSVFILSLLPALYFYTHQNNKEAIKRKSSAKIVNAVDASNITTQSVSSANSEHSIASLMPSSIAKNSGEITENNGIAANKNSTQSVSPLISKAQSINVEGPKTETAKSNSLNNNILKPKEELLTQNNEEKSVATLRLKEQSTNVEESKNKKSNSISENNNVITKEVVPYISSAIPESNNNDNQNVKPLIENQLTSSNSTVNNIPLEPAKQNPLIDESLNSSPKMEELKSDNNQNSTNLKFDSVTTVSKLEVSPLSVTKVDTTKANTPLLPIEDYRFFVGGIYAPEKVMTTLINVNANNSSLNETQNSSYSTGVRFGYRFNNNWSICSNVLYSKTSKSFSYYQFTLENDDDDHDSNLNKDLATSYGIISFPSNYVEKHPYGGQHPHHEGDTLIIDIKGLQKLTYLTIPISCQYQINKNRVSGLFSLGFTSSILLSQSAEISYINLDEKYATKIKGIQDIYFNGTIGIGVQYRIFNRFSVFIQPTFSQAFTSMNKNTSYRTYPSSISGTTGINFHF